LEIERTSATLCRHRVASLLKSKLSSVQQLMAQVGHSFLLRSEKCGLGMPAEGFFDNPGIHIHRADERKLGNHPDGKAANGK
ncbi:MAG TPA: hypothetical protein VMP01_04320, partial [Pirellulaceae bacterium]|nr:hypothetical protein [Pirellulaceae bacterium]